MVQLAPCPCAAFEYGQHREEGLPTSTRLDGGQRRRHEVPEREEAETCLAALDENDTMGQFPTRDEPQASEASPVVRVH